MGTVCARPFVRGPLAGARDAVRDVATRRPRRHGRRHRPQRRPSDGAARSVHADIPATVRRAHAARRAEARQSEGRLATLRYLGRLRLGARLPRLSRRRAAPDTDERAHDRDVRAPRRGALRPSDRARSEGEGSLAGQGAPHLRVRYAERGARSLPRLLRGSTCSTARSSATHPRSRRPSASPASTPFTATSRPSTRRRRSSRDLHRASRRGRPSATASFVTPSFIFTEHEGPRENDATNLSSRCSRLARRWAPSGSPRANRSPT